MPQAEERFSQIYERHHHQVAAYVRRRSAPDVAEDLVSEVFLTVWRLIDEAPEQQSVLPWLYRIAYLKTSNHWRSNSRRKRLTERAASLGVAAPQAISDQVVMRQELADVLEAASRLRPEDQELLRLASWEHLSASEIGDVLQIEPNAVSQRLYRARRALEREYERTTKTSPAARKGGER